MVKYRKRRLKGKSTTYILSAPDRAEHFGKTADFNTALATAKKLVRSGVTNFVFIKKIETLGEVIK